MPVLNEFYFGSIYCHNNIFQEFKQFFLSFLPFLFPLPPHILHEAFWDAVLLSKTSQEIFMSSSKTTVLCLLVKQEFCVPKHTL